MDNPWENIDLADYENHMQLDSVKQLQGLNQLMKGQFERYKVSSIMILGIAGGNGLEHIKEDTFKIVYGVDVNGAYLESCKKRYPQLKNQLKLIKADLTDKAVALPYGEMIIANLLIEYIGYQAFARIVEKVQPQYISCVIQINTDESFVSESPYLHVFDQLQTVHHQMDVITLNESMRQLKYALVYEEALALPNGKQLVCLEFRYSKMYKES